MSWQQSPMLYHRPSYIHDSKYTACVFCLYMSWYHGIPTDTAWNTTVQMQDDIVCHKFPWFSFVCLFAVLLKHTETFLLLQKCNVLVMEKTSYVLFISSIWGFQSTSSNCTSHEQNSYLTSYQRFTNNRHLHSPSYFLIVSP